MERSYVPGKHVIFIDEDRRRLHALVTHWHDGGDGRDKYMETYKQECCINLVFVSSDQARGDTYGRQTQHASSVVHIGQQPLVHGYCWCWPDEVPE